VHGKEKAPDVDCGNIDPDEDKDATAVVDKRAGKIIYRFIQFLSYIVFHANGNSASLI
jgi:hypothetical protein